MTGTACFLQIIETKKWETQRGRSIYRRNASVPSNIRRISILNNCARASDSEHIGSSQRHTTNDFQTLIIAVTRREWRARIIRRVLLKQFFTFYRLADLRFVLRFAADWILYRLSIIIGHKRAREKYSLINRDNYNFSNIGRKSSCNVSRRSFAISWNHNRFARKNSEGKGSLGSRFQRKMKAKEKQ